MKKLEEIQNTKIMSNYGGVGSIIETRTNGSLLIKDYGEWRCFTGQNINTRTTIENPRLIEELRGRGYNNMETLYKIPTPKDDEIDVHTPTGPHLTLTINSIYFPRWFYCKRRRTLRKLNEWDVKWREMFPMDRRNNDNENISNFRRNFPACDCCSRQRGNTQISRIKLEQFRFVMVSMDTGEIADIPFEYILNPNNGFIDTQNRFNANVAWIFTNDMTPCNGDLKYNVSAQSTSLASERVYCDNRYIDMATLNSKYLVFPDNMLGINRGAYKLVLRNASNICFPNILKAIYLPLLSDQDRNQIINQYEHMIANGIPQETAIEYIMIGRTDLSEFQIRDIIDEHVYPDRGIDLNNLAISEFNYVTNPHLYRNNRNERSEKDFTAVRYPNIHTNEIKNIYALTQLKETSVLLNYTRGSNKQCDWWNIAQNRVDEMTPGTKYPIQPNTTYLPAIEAYGEGLLFELNYVNGFDAVQMEIYAHTFSHLLMKELEFMCGYPVTSLKERLYFDTNNGRYGFLIYTIAGSEGSYGGLTSLMPSDTNSDGTNSDGTNSKILKLIERAKKRAEDCPNDPICINEGRHCFACVDLPETSCERWNNDLNRGLFLEVKRILNANNNANTEQPEENENEELEENNTSRETPDTDAAHIGNINFDD